MNSKNHMINELLQLQKTLTEKLDNTDQDWQAYYGTKLLFFENRHGFDLVFYGEGWDDAPDTPADAITYETNYGFAKFLDFLTHQKFADHITTLHFTGPDQGADGMRNWDFSRIINSKIVFPKLKSFSVSLTDYGDHNLSCIGANIYSEDGMIAVLITKMPNLHFLSIPSAPNIDFFKIESHPLKKLTIQAGANHEYFIDNLADNNNFKSLLYLDYTDYLDDSFITETDNYTSFESYKKLVQSNTFKNTEQFTFKLRDKNLTQEQLFELQRLTSVPILYINGSTGRYISHLMNKS